VTYRSAIELNTFTGFIPIWENIFRRWLRFSFGSFGPKRVYDPFCGCGTTLVEANTLGVDSVGCDISAFNCLMTRAKTGVYDVSAVDHGLRNALKDLRPSA